jgi:4-amino-4-deoxy-L-arabinose transferase-like glycosyltransferase
LDKETLLFTIGTIFLVVAVIFHAINKEKLSIIFLLSSSFFIFLFASQLYPFLNVWDERFHALVAKNLMHHPLKPTLYDEKIVNMVYDDNWGRYHIWLHKQPLFMWQMMLSYKIFGVNEFAMRFPSVILSCLTVYAAYRSGKILGNKNVGFYAGFLFVTSVYLMKLISGRVELDQNDTVFLTYISLSIWAWLEYYHTKKIFWVFLVGVFSGFAILCKWLVGLLVYMTWGVYSIFENKFQIKKYKGILLALLITIIVALPWQILILNWYPAEAKFSLELNGKHFTEPVDGHEGPFSYHFTLIDRLFGDFVTYLIIPAFIIFYFKTTNKKACISMFISVLAVYLFFSFAATKMPSFTIVVMLPIFLALAFLMDFLFSSVEKLNLSKGDNVFIISSLLLLLTYFRMDFCALYTVKSFSDVDDVYYRDALTHNKKIFQNLSLLPANTVVFNDPHYVETMYYSGFPAYKFLPSLEQYNDMKQKKRVIAYFRPLNNSIPQYLREDKEVIVIKDTIRICQ